MKPADAATVPLCATHHQAFHRIGVETFEFRYDVDLGECAAQRAAMSPHPKDLRAMTVTPDLPRERQLEAALGP
jgi:hypothetical protein